MINCRVQLHNFPSHPWTPTRTNSTIYICITSGIPSNATSCLSHLVRPRQSQSQFDERGGSGQLRHRHPARQPTWTGMKHEYNEHSTSTIANGNNSMSCRNSDVRRRSRRSSILCFLRSQSTVELTAYRKELLHMLSKAKKLLLYPVTTRLLVSTFIACLIPADPQCRRRPREEAVHALFDTCSASVSSSGLRQS